MVIMTKSALWACLGFIIGLLSLLTVVRACPGGCTCSIRPRQKNDDSLDYAGYYGDQSTSEVEFGDREVLCVDKRLTTPIDPSSIPEDTYYVDLSENEIRTLSTYSFTNLGYVQKLNLSGNVIEEIQSRAFSGLIKLEELDLSRNNLASVNNFMFEGLEALKKLNLSHNRIATVPSSAFERLISLEKVDFQSPILMCDCNMKWIIKWKRINNVRIVDATACVFPELLRGESVRRLHKSDLSCDHPMQLPMFTLTPSEDQLVFAGNVFPLVCQATMVDESLELRWWRNGHLLSDGPRTSIVETRQEGVKTSTLTLTITGAGELWNMECKASSSTGTKQQGVLLTIMAAGPYCGPVTDSTNKGNFEWPGRVGGGGANLPCPYGAGYLYGSQEDTPMATRRCNSDGHWDDPLTGNCAYSDSNMQLLEKYSLMTITNSSFATQVARKVQVVISDAKTIDDPQTIIFVGKLMDTFKKFPSQGVGRLMLNIASNVMEVSPQVLAQSQSREQSCSKIVLALERFAASVLTDRVQVFHYETPNIAMQAHRVTPAGFVGMTCASFIRDLGKRDEYDEQHFKCNVRNITGSKLNNSHSMVEAAIQLPSTIFGRTSGGPSTNFRLQFLVYKNARLFPSQEIDTQTLVEGSVISSNIDNIPFSNLTDNVVLRFRHGVPSSRLHQLQPGYWDFNAEGRLGAWKSNGCTITEKEDNMVVMKCNHLTNFALLRVTDREDTPMPVRIFSDLLHPSIYITTFIFVLLILLVLISYTCCYRSIRVKAKAKHSLINICVCLLILAMVFAGGINRTSPEIACKCVGMALHYFSICCLLWVAIAARNLAKALSKSDRPQLAPGETLPPPRPVIRFYFVGWGIPMIIVGITAAASKNLVNYGGTEFCWISDFTISIVSFFGVAALIVIATCIFFIVTTRRISQSRSRQHLGRTQMYEIPGQTSTGQNQEPRNRAGGPPSSVQYGSHLTVNSHQYPPISEHSHVGPPGSMTDQFGSRVTVNSSQHPTLAEQHISVSMNLNGINGGQRSHQSINTIPNARSQSFNTNANADPRTRSHESLSSVTSCLLDQERPHAKQLHSLLSLFLGFLVVWALGAMIVLLADTVSTAFVYLYSAALIAYGLFIFINHCALRNDVLLRWKRACRCAQQEAYSVNVPTDTSQQSNGHVIQRRPSAGSVDSGVTNQSHNTNHSNPSYRSGSRLTSSHCNYMPTNLHTGTDASIDSSTQENMPPPFLTDRRVGPPQGRYNKSRNRSRNPRYSRHSRQSREFSDGGSEPRGNPPTGSRAHRKEYTTAMIVGEARRNANHSDGAPSKSLEHTRHKPHAGSASSVEQSEGQRPQRHRSRGRSHRTPQPSLPSPLPEEEPLMGGGATGDAADLKGGSPNAKGSPDVKADTPPPPSYDEVTEKKPLLPTPEQPMVEGEQTVGPVDILNTLAESQPAVSSVSVDSDKRETSV